MSEYRDLIERGALAIAVVAYLAIAAVWIVSAPWTFLSLRWNLSFAAAGAAPWALLIGMALRRHRLAAWLAVGACTASLHLGWGGRTFFSAAHRHSALAYDLTCLLPILGAATLLLADRLRGESLHPRHRITAVGLGAVLPWALVFLFYALQGVLGETQTWGGAPEAALPLLPLILGGVALARGRTWGLLPILVALPLLLLVEVPPPAPSCFGPQGHPFGYGWAREVFFGSAALMIAPWIRPLARHMRGPVEMSRQSWRDRVSGPPR